MGATRRGQRVWFEEGRLCAEMPALILYDTVFEPMWEHGDVERGRVCIKAPRGGFAVVRVGKGVGWRGGEKYYYVDFGGREVARLKHKPVRKLQGGWMTCVWLPSGKRLCFEWRDGRLAAASLPVDL